MGGRVRGKVAIVTGAGSIGAGVGNGKASAILYAREGARVMLADYNLEAAEETKKVIDKEGGDCIAFRVDVTKADDCRDMAEKCIQTYGKIDILHNNVGTVEWGNPVEMSEEIWDKVLNINLKSMFLTCKFVLPYMEKQGSGSIVNISSAAGVRGGPSPSPAYSASKAGVIGFTRQVAVEYAAKGIRVNAIVPGYMLTPLQEFLYRKHYGTNVDILKEELKRRDVTVPLGRHGEGWDTGYLALFLASDESKYITGETMVVDGGLTMSVPRIWNPEGK
ncbi:MAG: SDR family oxidoreductase [Chloroflexota bacterium]|nr:MAG: SDR family oxidoreductase [Chloroflexota bacterium]